MVATHRIIKGVSVLLKVLVVLAVVALLIPLILYTYPQALIAIILENNYYADKSPHPRDYGLSGVNFYIEGSATLIPVWHLYPAAKNFKTLEDVHEDLRKNDTKFFVFLHGTKQPRTKPMEMYKTLMGAGFHLIVPELRGFNDAAGPFTAFDSVEDLAAVQHWLTSHFPQKKIIWWCLSLGAGICLQTAPQLTADRPHGIVLEAPFSSMREMLMSRTLFVALGGWFTPLTEAVFEKMESRYGMHYRNKENLLKLPDIPVLHVMAEDDAIIPYDVHFRAIKDAVIGQRGRQADYFPVTIPGCRGLGHYPLSRRSNDTFTLLNNFWEEVVSPGTHTARSRRKGLPTTATSNATNPPASSAIP